MKSSVRRSTRARARDLARVPSPLPSCAEAARYRPTFRSYYTNYVINVMQRSFTLVCTGVRAAYECVEARVEKSRESSARSARSRRTSQNKQRMMRICAIGSALYMPRSLNRPQPQYADGAVKAAIAGQLCVTLVCRAASSGRGAAAHSVTPRLAAANSAARRLRLRARTWAYLSPCGRADGRRRSCSVVRHLSFGG